MEYRLKRLNIAGRMAELGDPALLNRILAESKKVPVVEAGPELPVSTDMSRELHSRYSAKIPQSIQAVSIPLRELR